MAYLTEQPVWEEGIYQYEITDPLQSGENGIDNLQGKQLANRTSFLNSRINDHTNKINAMEGRGGYLIAHDFGTHTPSQDGLNGYALTQIHSENLLDIWNGTHVKNIYVDPDTVDQDHPRGIPDNHVWILTNTPDTEPPIHEWIDDGFDSISVFADNIAGVITGAADPGDGTMDGYIKPAEGGRGKVIGAVVYKNWLFPAGSFYEQLPDAQTPVERGLPGTWEIWSSRAVLYGVRASMPSYTAYTSLAGTAIAAGSTPTAYLALNGDFGLFTFISQSAAYTVPSTFDPVKWNRYSDGVTIYERQKCGNALTAADYAIGAKIASGTYANKYIVEKLVPGGKFFGIEGGFRPTFVSGGRQSGATRRVSGEITRIMSAGAVQYSGVISIKNEAQATLYGSGLGWYGTVGFDTSSLGTLYTGSDFRPTNLSTRLWRRIS